jgi:hypothetical protein
MADFIISPYAISFDSIKNNLQQYVSSKPENETWLDFYASSAGETIIEIAAALGAFYAYHFIVGRRETFLSCAENRTSLIGLSQNLGYSVSRGDNLKVSINIVPNQTITLAKWAILGSYTEYDVILSEDIILNQGTAIDVPVIIGNSMIETINVNSNKLQQFSFLNDRVTDTYRLLLNDRILPVSTEIKDALNDKYVTISNVYGAMDVFYLQQGEYQYMAGDNLYLQFVESNNLTYNDFSSSNLNIDYANQINEVKLIKDKTDLESLASIKAKAPLYHETSMVIRARKDYSKYLKLKHPQIIEANDKDIYPGLIAISYIKEDGSSLTEEEKEYWLNQIEESRPSGVAKAVIIDSNVINKTLNISLWKGVDKNIDSTISDTIDKILKGYENIFETKIDLNQIEHDIEKLDNIKIARVEIDSEDRASDTFYRLYDNVKIDGTDFYCGSFVNKTGSEEPTWPRNIGDIVLDGDIIWKKVNEFKGIAVYNWEPNTEKSEYDYIKVDIKNEDGDIIGTDIFTCIGFVNTSSKVEPEWGQEFINDNELIWQKIEYDFEVENKWQPETVYTIGDIISNPSGIYRCANYRAKSGADMPTLEDLDNGLIRDGNIIWTIMDVSHRMINLGWNEHIKLNKVITIAG